MPAFGRELGLRVATAAVLLPPLGLALARGGWWCAGLLGIAAALGTSEFYRLTGVAGRAEAALGVGAALALPLLPTLAPGRAAGTAFWVVALVAAAAWVGQVARGQVVEAPARAGRVASGLLFTGPGLLALAQLRAGPDGLAWTALVLAGTWGNDALAYLGGRRLGRHKLAPRVSPGKTWEGLACGALGSLAGVLAVRALLPGGARLREGLALAAAMSIAGPLGDLSKSALKRACGAKDSGRLLPGHGGVLDRIDALLFNAPLVLAWADWAAPG